MTAQAKGQSGARAMFHSIERTSPMGGPFIGRCLLCGMEGLTSALQPCANPGDVSADDALIEAIDPSPAPVPEKE